MGEAVAPIPGRTPDVVGRETEVARIDAFVRAVGEGTRALVIRGEPGIGKTALWWHAVAGSRRSRLQVVVTRPAEEEMPLALVGLVDLLEHAGLDTAALRAEEDPIARGRAVLDTLRRLAERAPAVLAIDDLQWLDSASARALRYALRRLDHDPVGLLATARPGAGGDDPLAVASTFPAERYEALDLGPLSLGALRRALGEIVTAISRPALRRIHEVSGGNPLYAIELARAQPETWPPPRSWHAKGSRPPATPRTRTRSGSCSIRRPRARSRALRRRPADGRRRRPRGRADALRPHRRTALGGARRRGARARRSGPRGRRSDRGRAQRRRARRAGDENREIGRAQHMSVASVEAHLTRIYRKLEIRSRSELAPGRRRQHLAQSEVGAGSSLAADASRRSAHVPCRAWCTQPSLKP